MNRVAHFEIYTDNSQAVQREQIDSGRAFYNYGTLPEWAADIEDLSGDTTFYKDESRQIFHTYSTFGRGGEEFLGIYRFFDATPKARNENGPYHSLTDWARPRICTAAAAKLSQTVATVNRPVHAQLTGQQPGKTL